jgi:repressor LexA
MPESIEDLPPRQREVLRLIVSLTEEHGYPPTLAELAQAMGLRNRMTVHQHVVALKKKLLVHWEPGLNRSLTVIGEAAQDQRESTLPAESQTSRRGVPLAGTIAAGRPIDAIETDEYLEIESGYADSGCFALKIKGDSMLDDGIHDGDYVIVKPQPTPRNGEIVVAVLGDGTATLKRIYKEKGGFRLQPANSQMEPILLDKSENLQVQGVVVGLFRKFS